MSTALVPIRYLPLETFARTTRLHPDLVRRLVALGLLDTEAGPDGEPWFHPEQVAVAARIERLRCWLGLTYSSIGVVIDLLDRVERLEAALREHEARAGTPTSIRIRTRGASWTRRA